MEVLSLPFVIIFLDNMFVRDNKNKFIVKAAVVTQQTHFSHDYIDHEILYPANCIDVEFELYRRT